MTLQATAPVRDQRVNQVTTVRSTRAVAAVERLKTRSGNAGYAMVRTAAGLFYLCRKSEAGERAQVGDAMPLDAFVAFVDALEPARERKASKLDVAFERQLTRKKTP